ncbi:hypothetical protein [Oricola sp.]|uniref:hypothetical protein n=1 Tax=Oricola sp. TaxID=1979950 RepID=UPI0025F53ED3|nr:hypothetical protein [Oricola sp.]MCI5073680.1 hypothetical protein [Oricola sp.]
MDPTLFLSGQAFQEHHASKTGQSEVDAFYDLHGPNVFWRLSRLRARLTEAWIGLRTRRHRAVVFAPEAQRG